MEQYNSVQQLLKKKEGHKDRKPVFPSTVIQAVFDGKTGASLEAILAQFNSIYIQYQGSPEATRNIIPVEMRRAGLTITYMNMDSETITERATSAVQKDNDHWSLNINWTRVDELSLSGDIAVSANGTWIINGEDTGVKAVGPKGDAGITPWLKTIDNKLHFSYDNVRWEPCSENIAAWFRFKATSSTGLEPSVGKFQISRDNKNWEDLSPEITNALRIAGYVATSSALPSGKPVGIIFGVGPTFAAEDTAHTNPIYRLYVYDGSKWVDNGTFTSIAAGVTQETGDSETLVMLQKATTAKLSELGQEVRITNAEDISQRAFVAVPIKPMKGDVYSFSVKDVINSNAVITLADAPSPFSSATLKEIYNSKEEKGFIYEFEDEFLSTAKYIVFSHVKNTDSVVSYTATFSQKLPQNEVLKGLKDDIDIVRKSTEGNANKISTNGEKIDTIESYVYGYGKVELGSLNSTNGKPYDISTRARSGYLKMGEVLANEGYYIVSVCSYDKDLNFIDAVFPTFTSYLINNNDVFYRFTFKKADESEIVENELEGIMTYRNEEYRINESLKNKQSKIPVKNELLDDDSESIVIEDNEGNALIEITPKQAKFNIPISGIEYGDARKVLTSIGSSGFDVNCGGQFMLSDEQKQTYDVSSDLTVTRVLQILLGYDVSNICAYSGHTASCIFFKNGDSCYIFKKAIVLPKDKSVVSYPWTIDNIGASMTSNITRSDLLNSYKVGTFEGIVNGYNVLVNSIDGTIQLLDDSDFNIQIPAGSLIYRKSFKRTMPKANAVTQGISGSTGLLLQVGANSEGATPQEILDYCELAIKKSGCKWFVILRQNADGGSDLNGAVTLLKSKYGANYIDHMSYLKSVKALKSVGVTPTTSDTYPDQNGNNSNPLTENQILNNVPCDMECIATNRVPSSFWHSAYRDEDEQTINEPHFNALGLECIGKYIYDVINLCGILQ